MRPIMQFHEVGGPGMTAEGLLMRALGLLALLAAVGAYRPEVSDFRSTFTPDTDVTVRGGYTEEAERDRVTSLPGTDLDQFGFELFSG